MMSVNNLSKLYSKSVGIEDISFTLAEGKILGVFGYSGGGKSTLLNCLCGLLPFETGSITVAGKTIDASHKHIHQSERVTYREHIGVVYQQLYLFPHMSVLQNITEAPVSLKKLSPEEARKRAGELLQFFGLEEKHPSYPVHLSGGEQQRVAIARAVIMQPRVLLLDEPTSALDPLRSADIRKFLRQYVTEGRSVVIVSHSIGFLKDLADEVIFLEKGRIIEQGSAPEVMNNPKNERTARFLSHS